MEKTISNEEMNKHIEEVSKAYLGSEKRNQLTDERIRQLVQNFMDTTYEAVKGYCPKQETVLNFSDVMDVIAEKYGLTESQKKTMSFTEFITLLEPLKDSNEEFYKWFYYSALLRTEQLLIKMSKNEIPVKILLGLTIKDFYRILENEKCDKRLLNEYKEVITNIRKRYPKSGPDTSIFVLLCRCEGEILSPWTPYRTDIGEFEDKVIGAYMFLKRIMIDSLMLAYPERFNSKDIENKYMIGLEEK